MKVKNLHGSTTCPCCNSWLEHWENYTHEKTDKCSKLGCGEKATLGGHVIKVEGDDKSRYIIPICDATNKEEAPYDLKSGTRLVPATKQISCHR